MGRAYQELGHLSKAIGNDENAASHYRQACELNPALFHHGSLYLIILQK